MAKDPPTDGDLAERLAKLEKELVTKQRAEEIAAAAALDVLKLYEGDVKKASQAAADMMKALDKREFARRVAASLDDRVCRRGLDELMTDVVQDEIARAMEAKVADAVAARMAEIDSAEKPEVSDVETVSKEELSQRLEEASKRLAERLDRIEREALPQLVADLVDQGVTKKLAETPQEGPGGPGAANIDGEALRLQVLEVAATALGDIANSPQFKAMLDEKFKVMMNYLVNDVIPKQVRRQMGG